MNKGNSSFHRIKQEADKGDANAQLLLADVYLDGRFITKNIEEALRLFELSAKQGNAKAQVEVEKLRKLKLSDQDKQ